MEVRRDGRDGSLKLRPETGKRGDTLDGGNGVLVLQRRRGCIDRGATNTVFVTVTVTATATTTAMQPAADACTCAVDSNPATSLRCAVGYSGKQRHRVRARRAGVSADAGRVRRVPAAAVAVSVRTTMRLGEAGDAVIEAPVIHSDGAHGGCIDVSVSPRPMHRAATAAARAVGIICSRGVHSDCTRGSICSSPSRGTAVNHRSTGVSSHARTTQCRRRRHKSADGCDGVGQLERHGRIGHPQTRRSSVGAACGVNAVCSTHGHIHASGDITVTGIIGGC
jgi:hypothetical protein